MRPHALHSCERTTVCRKWPDIENQRLTSLPSTVTEPYFLSRLEAVYTMS